MAKLAMARSRAVIVALALLFVQLQVRDVDAWAADGHHITCLIAETLLYEETVKAVTALLPNYVQGNLASLCTWPDDVRWQYKYRWSKELHYVDTPDFLCRYDYNRDCHSSEGIRDVCVAGAINNFTGQLQAYAKNHLQTENNMTEALLFLSHFIGDIHQPLHTGFISDAGGNNITVHWYNRRSNLHHVWDYEFIAKALIENYNSDVTVMTDSLLNNITDNWASEADSWGICHNNKISCPDTYAIEGVSFACKWAYRGATPGSFLSDAYYLSRLPIVERRLAQGGIRLASILNSIFDPEAPQQSCSQTSIENRKFQIVLQGVLHKCKEIRMGDQEFTSVKRSAYSSLDCT